MTIRARLDVLLLPIVPIIQLDLNLRRRLKEEKVVDARKLQKEGSMNLHYVTHYVHYLVHLVASH